MIETVAPLPTLRHLVRLSDAVGIFEHAKLDRPRPECGYCTDDAGRLLAIASRMAPDPNAPLLAQVALGFLERAHLGGGRFRLRQRVDGTWTDDRPERRRGRPRPARSGDGGGTGAVAGPAGSSARALR